MDSDLWISRLAAAKRHFALQHHQSSQLDRSSMDDFEAEEEGRQDFPCPYCYEDHEFASLCSHLEEEHSFESKVGACPICSVKIGRDMLNHIILHHGHLLKRRRRLRRFGVSNSQALSLLGKDLHEAQVLLESGAYRSSNTSTSTTITDSLLSSLVFNFPTSVAEETAKPFISSAEDYSSKKLTPLHNWKSSCDLSLSYEEREQKRTQATGRAIFVQDLILSTLTGD